MKVWNFIKNNIFVRNLLLAAGISFVLVVIVLVWLNFYTQHGKAVDVPDVKGLQVDEAAPFFENKSLRFVVVDSAYYKNAAPGSIVETVPSVGTKVKEGRTIYLTINSFSSETFVIPEVQDLSQRQAMSMLKAIGFESIQVRSVPGAYQDLVLGLENRGRAVSPGDRLPANSRLTLLVSSGQSEVTLSTDSVVENDSSEETWF